MIPRRLIRSVPAETTAEVEEFWRIAAELHPGWDLVTYRDPLDSADWPLSGHVWADRGLPGAQVAGFVRLEALWQQGGIWLDSDVELYRPLSSLLGCRAFACWEDPSVVPDAVLGAEAHHPAILACLDLAIDRIAGGSTDWATGAGPWGTGPGVTTTILPGRDDVLLLPPGSFFPYHYSQRDLRYADHHSEQPWAFGAHHWFGSWLSSP